MKLYSNLDVDMHYQNFGSAWLGVLRGNHGLSFVGKLTGITGEPGRCVAGHQFIDRVHIFGNGCAVTKRGASPAASIYHALRTFKLVPSGASSRPSTT